MELKSSTLRGAAAGGQPPPGARRETGAKSQRPGGRAAAAVAVPAHQPLAAGELGDELHGGGAVVDHDQVAARG